MVKKVLREEIDRAIKEVWKKNIRNDYKNSHLFNEDTLKNSFYFHLRRKLGTKFLEENNIRIFTEFYVKDMSLFADMAIFELGNKFDGYISDNIKSYIAIIEFKWGGIYTQDSYFNIDIEKVKGYIQKRNIDKCLYYLGFINEKERSDSLYWLDGRRTGVGKWTDKKVTVLSASFEIEGNDELCFYIQSCNGLNKDMDD